ncbi:MAG: elongation factor P [Alphaproteobacteria bacterium]
MKMNAIDIRSGNALMHDGKLFVVLKATSMNPGKGASVMQVEMRDVNTGNKVNVRFRTQETVERARLDETNYQYLFADGDLYTFMHQETFEQIEIAADVIGESRVYLQDGMICVIQTHEGNPLAVTLPTHATFEIIEAEPVVKGQTASSSYKPAVLDNDARIMVPPHIQTGTRVVVKTEDGTYVERAKD